MKVVKCCSASSVPARFLARWPSLTPRSRTATARAVTDVELIEIDRGQIAERIDRSDPVVRSLLEGLLKRYRNAMSTMRGKVTESEDGFDNAGGMGKDPLGIPSCGMRLRVTASIFVFNRFWKFRRVLSVAMRHWYVGRIRSAVPFHLPSSLHWRKRPRSSFRSANMCWTRLARPFRACTRAERRHLSRSMFPRDSLPRKG